MGSRSRLRARVTFLVAIGSLVVAGGVGLLLTNTVKLRNSSDATARSDDYSAQVVNVERLVVDTETGLRGYVITGRPQFLGPARMAAAQLPAALDALRRQARNNRAFEAQAQTYANLVRSYLSSYVPEVERLVSTNPAAARSFEVTLAGKRKVDATRAQSAFLERLIARTQATRERAAHDIANTSIAEAIVALVLLTLLVAGVGGLLGHLVVDRERALQRSEQTTRSLQRSILPLHIPPIPGCQLAVRFTPAGGHGVGGDFYDVFELGDGRWAVLVGDVCGKGAEAAAVSAMARWTLRSLAESLATPADGLRFVNEVMLRQELDGRFVTIALSLLDVGGAMAQVTTVAAGHPAPLLVPASGEPTTVETDGDLLGIWPTIRLHTAKAELRPGDSLVIYTDGVTDQGPGAPPSPQLTLGNRRPGADAEQLAAMVEGLATSHGRPPRDDVAVLAVRFLGDGAAGTGQLGSSAVGERVQASAVPSGGPLREGIRGT
jgi:serine phosphatase RsbU (regulator of sigma subunit)